MVEGKDYPCWGSSAPGSLGSAAQRLPCVLSNHLPRGAEALDRRAAVLIPELSAGMLQTLLAFVAHEVDRIVDSNRRGLWLAALDARQSEPALLLEFLLREALQQRLLNLSCLR